MSLIKLLVGVGFIYFGYTELNQTPSQGFGWVFVVIGALLVLSNFTSDKKSSGRSGYSFYIGDSDGGSGDSGGGGD